MSVRGTCLSVLAIVVVAACGGNQPPAAVTATSAAGPSGLGGSCVSDADCQSGLSCDKDDPGGQCEKTCSSNSDCGPAAVCQKDDNQMKCFRACKTDADCNRKGYACIGNAYCDAANERDEH